MKKTIKIEDKLQSTNPETIHEGIEEARHSGNIAHLLPIVELLYTTSNTTIKQAAINFFNDLKSPEAVPIIIDIINTPRYATLLPHLLSACWQSGLDFSPYWKTFIDIAINHTHESLVEIITIIDNIIISLPLHDIEEQQFKIKSAIQSMTYEKQVLASELIKTLNQKKPFHNLHLNTDL